MRYVIIIIALCALVIGALFLMGPAEADTIIVDDDWSGADYSTISEALMNAEKGDTIRVYAGTYNEANDVQVPINLIGNGTDTIIDGYKKDHVFGFNLLAGDTNVSGFYFYRWWPTHHFAGVGVYSNGNRITDNTFYRNGRGIFLGGCNDNVIFNNTFDKGYYDVLVYEGAHETRISFNTFSSVYAYSISIGRSNDVEIFSNTFYYDYRGGGVSVHRGENVTLAYNMFNGALGDPVAKYGGRFYDMKTGHVHNNTFLDVNQSIWIMGTEDFTIADNTFVNGSIGMMAGRIWSGRQQLGDWCNGTLVRNNNIVNQGVYGFDATYGQVTSIDARLNWWGDSTGPYHPVNNSMGTGTNASDLVTFDKWLGSMNDGLPPISYIFNVRPALVNEGEAVSFEGRGLARNTTVEYLWSSSIDGELYSGNASSFSTTELSPGVHTISFKVKDDFGKWSSEATTKVTVNGIPKASIVSISPPLVNDGETVSFVGAAFDHEYDVRYVIWESDIDGVLSNELEFETSSLSNGTHVITLTVIDGHDVWSAPAVGEVIVNGRPIAFVDSVEHPEANEGDAIIFRGAYIDHEDGIIGHLWTSDVDGELSDQQFFHTSSLSNGTHVITYRVLDDFLVWSEEVTTSVTINGLPRARIVSITPELPSTGETVVFEGDSEDHEDDVVAFEWYSDVDGLLSTHEDFETDRLSMGVHTITFRAMDGHRIWSEWEWTTITVNARPEAWIEHSDVKVVNQGEVYHLAGGFSDAEDDIRGYEWTSDLDGVIGTFYNLTTRDLSNGSHLISFRVMDAHGAWSDEATAQVVVNGLPEAIIVGISPAKALEGEPVGFTGAYLDHEADTYKFEWVSDRDGLLSDEMGFTTSYLSNGTHVISLRVMDGHGAWSEPVTGRVHVNGKPTCWIESVDPVHIVVGDRVLFAGAGDDDLAVTAYRWTSSIDGDLSDIAVFSTRSLSPGTHDISFAVQDNEGVWSIPASVIVEVGTLTASARVAGINLPEYAIEGYQVTVGCVIENDGDLPLMDLVIRFSLGEHLVAVHTLTEPLHPGSRTTVELPWLAETGTHLATVEVMDGDVVIASAGSTDTLLVDPLPDDDDDPGPGPSDDDSVVDGNDVSGMTFFLVLLATLVAVSYMGLMRPRRSI
ncbi:MAG: right-handed parallel beta-helix repeat-containing protein [Thermoplasmata archaeon]|nr:MAG: right-handed parallel beta-helix repeat-containing protein [Thermoplasmata archaeon]